MNTNRTCLSIATALTATEIADLLNNTGYKYGITSPVKARAWEGKSQGRVYFGSDFVTVQDGEVTNKNPYKVRACTACDDAIEAIAKATRRNETAPTA